MKQTPEEFAQGIINRQRDALAKAAPKLARELAARRAIEILEKDGSVTVADLIASFEESVGRANPDGAILERAAIIFLRSLQSK